VLPEDALLRRDTAAIASEIGGSDAFDVLVPAGSALAEPVGVGLLASYVLTRPGVAGPAGPALRADNGDWLASFVLAAGGSTAREELFADVEARAAALGAPEVRATGAAVQVARDSGRLIRSVARGSLSTLVVLFALFWLAFRSAFYAALAMIPNVLPCILVYSGLALLGRPLSFATAMISTVMLGLIVDDTIHLLHGFRELRAAGSSALAALESVFERSGRAVLITSVVLGVGFSAGLCGRLTTTVEFCGLAAATIAVALLSDAVLLPAILVAPRRAEPLDASA
jgi:predicted RND superfamily exporter protein